MSRLPYVRREELEPEGQQLWDGIVNGRSDVVLTAEGGLAGPFNAFVTAPGTGRRLSALGAKLRFDTGPVGSVDKIRLQRVIDVMRRFLGFGKFDIGSMLMGSTSSTGG